MKGQKERLHNDTRRTPSPTEPESFDIRMSLVTQDELVTQI